MCQTKIKCFVKAAASEVCGTFAQSLPPSTSLFTGVGGKKSHAAQFLLPPSVLPRAPNLQSEDGILSLGPTTISWLGDFERVISLLRASVSSSVKMKTLD